MPSRTPTDSDLTQPTNVPGDAPGDGTPAIPPADGAGVQADPPPVPTATADRPVAGDGNPSAGEHQHRSGAGRPTSLALRDGNGRFRAKPADLAAEHSLIELDAALFLEAQHHRLAAAKTILASYIWNGRADDLEALTAIHAGLVVRVAGGGRS